LIKLGKPFLISNVEPIWYQALIIMKENQDTSEVKNPVIKALIASYKKLVSIPTKEEKRAARRIYTGTNSRIRRAEVSSSVVAEE
jgi:hypothetical protein